MTRAKSRYVPALDGMRAFAVLAVIAYHMKMSWAPGGLLGVTMFFVLSGYLITGLLLKEYDETGTISLSSFWVRRVRRIIPAVVFAVFGIGLLCTIFDHALLTKMRPDVVPTLLFVNNWWQIVHNVSYFAALGEPSPLTHFWSLAIEEQFYVIWPVALLICMKAGVRKSTMLKGILVLIGLSALEMIILYNPSLDPSRVYYGTDTRAFSLLIGSFLAFIWPHQALDERAGEDMTPLGKLTFNLAGVLAVFALLLMCGITNGFSSFIYRGGLLLCSLLTAIAIAVMVHPISWVGKFFELPPLVWVGKCSYSMYLWHYPIILLMTPNNLVGDAPIWLRLVQLVIIFAVSAFSYYVVETPIRRGVIGDFIDRVRAGEFTVVQWAYSHVVGIVLTVALFAVPLVGFAVVPDTLSVDNVNVLQSGVETLEGDSSGGQEEESSEFTALVDRVNSVAPYDILLIGDSVPAGLEGYGVFYDVFPYGHIDALVNRRLPEAVEIYSRYRDERSVGDVVVIALGTNGYVTDAETDELMATIGSDKHVWFVNTRSQTEFVADTNAALARCADKYDNVELIDWYALSATLGDYVFDGDGTHLTVDGCHDYAEMIRSAVADYLPKHEAGEKPRDEALREATEALAAQAKQTEAKIRAWADALKSSSASA